MPTSAFFPHGDRKHGKAVIVQPIAAATARMFGPEQLAGEDLKAKRLAICATCQFNAAGICRQCCSGVPVKVLVNLKASRCGRGHW